MRFFGVASAVKAAVYVIYTAGAREAAWEDILTGDWLPDLRAQLCDKIVGDSATPNARQAEALDCIDELLPPGDRDRRPSRAAAPPDHQLISDMAHMDLQEAWTWCALPPSIVLLALPRHLAPHSRARHRLPLAIGLALACTPRAHLARTHRARRNRLPSRRGIAFALPAASSAPPLLPAGSAPRLTI